ncbi:hypothetical protein MPTK1_1g15460 [Marchantia polymorpha subsp. ruderalis]|nr:hypothetical protein MARPO_0033s0115 [Marchantia polymorpha]BBM98689.1 hypothetical protein Mp_1g15460 [Marchantia polymorpha subsp. ruderalis]|eukprot:PTQ41719.1 hypothetical protein MARPO_0033s0115 [Marchantia polymorpha]
MRINSPSAMAQNLVRSPLGTVPAIGVQFAVRQSSCQPVRRKMVCEAASSQRVSFKGSVDTDLPLREIKNVPFEQYMSADDRIFNALFPDKQRRQRLSEEEWRIFMLPLQFFYLSVRPVVDMRVKLQDPRTKPANGKSVSKLITLEATRWELRGLEYTVNPEEFELGIAGSLYPERGQFGSRLKGQMKLTVDLAIPSSLALMPSAVMESIGTAVINQLLEDMKTRVNTRLLEDYRDYAIQQQRIKKVSSA